MSISGISSSSNCWQCQNQATQGSSGASAASSNVTNTGTAAATSNGSAFMQAFSADLQAMLARLAEDASANTTSSTDGSASQTTASQTQATAHAHHHHHSHGAGESGSTQEAANQTADVTGPSSQGSSTSQIDQSASAFAAKVIQMLQSYGTTAATSSSAASILA